jgi:4-hydroxybenzoate polyprenyltransferase
VLDLLRAIRLPNILLVAIAQLLILHKYDSFSFENILLVILTSLWIMWGNIDNDVKDLELDTKYKSKPNNQIIQWLSQKSRALVLEQNLLVISLSISVFISIKAIFLTVLAWTSLKFYNLYFKKMPLIGNVIIAFLCMASLHVFNSKSTMNLQIISLLIFISTFLRELIKDKEDEQADLACGYKTLAIICDSFVFKFILICLGIALTYLAVLFFGLNYYALICFIVLQLFQLYFIYIGNWGKASLMIKWQILIGVVMIAFI